MNNLDINIIPSSEDVRKVYYCEGIKLGITLEDSPKDDTEIDVEVKAFDFVIKYTFTKVCFDEKHMACLHIRFPKKLTPVDAIKVNISHYERDFSCNINLINPSWDYVVNITDTNTFVEYEEDEE